MRTDGYWPRFGVRVYLDSASGYLLVHWEDAHKVPGCLSNGYYEKGIPDDEINWGGTDPIEKDFAIKRKAIREVAFREVIEFVKDYTDENFYPPDHYTIERKFIG